MGISMLTYQLQKRIYKLRNGEKLTFPNDVEIEICLEPTAQFGVPTKETDGLRRLRKTGVEGGRNTAMYDANTGRQGLDDSVPPFDPVQESCEWTNLKMEMQGNIVHVKARCSDFKRLDTILQTCHYSLPIALNLELAEPPTVKYTRGKVGRAAFSWEIEQAVGFLDITSKEKQETRIGNSFLRLNMINKVENTRLAAALYHFYVARRLAESGNSPYEFLAEIILNLTKTLQALFGEKYDDVRIGLAKFGYPKNEIEEKFIPIMILRNQFDVGHISLKLFSQENLTKLYRYLEKSELIFRDLLKLSLQKVDNKEYTLKQINSSLTGDSLRKFEKLILTIEREQSD